MHRLCQENPSIPVQNPTHADAAADVFVINEKRKGIFREFANPVTQRAGTARFDRKSRGTTFAAARVIPSAEDYVVKITKILAPTDLSKLSRAAVRYAVETALAQGAEVLVYNVISEDSDWFDKQDALNPAHALVPKQKLRLDEFIRESCAEFIGKVNIRQAVEVGVPYK
ncbi:MAG TPA: universal stress protein, partial [Candidatus Binatia bacterium]|nr:universal stress protein [Candidatus Binatia bacterium]